MSDQNRADAVQALRRGCQAKGVHSATPLVVCTFMLAKDEAPMRAIL